MRQELDNQLIGIVTSVGFANAGTVFQAYALQQFISRLPGFKAELVNYRMDAPKFNNIAYAYGYGPLSWGIQAFFHIRTYRFNSFQRRKFVLFPPKKPIKREDLPSINNRYDQFVLGSDQIWNTKFNNFDTTFFLDFVKGKRKGAYAPSMGMDDFPEEEKMEIKRLLAEMDYIGVREKQSVPVVQLLTDTPVHWSIDPTFLLDKKDWEKEAKKPNQRGDYIFEYCISKNETLRVATEKLSEMTGLPIIEYGGARKRVPSAKRMPHPSADTVLGYLMNAKYVVTDSFHGCALSINTNTPFFAIITGFGSRVRTVLDLFGLNDRIVTDGNKIDPTVPINWSIVNDKLEEVREENGNWLLKQLNGEQ